MANNITRTDIIGKGTSLWKALLQGRIPWRYHDRFNAIKARLKTKKVLKTCPIKLDTNSDVEMKMLLNKRHICMALLTLKSFLRFHNKINITIHGDGSLNTKSQKILKKHIPGVKIITLRESNNLMEEKASDVLMNIKNNVSKYFPTHPITTLKWTDFVHLSKCPRIILLDSDTLFMKKPCLILDWIEKAPDYALYTESAGDNITWKEDFLKKEFPCINVIKRINSGLVCMDKNIMLKNIDMVSKELIENPSFRAGINSGDQDIHRIVLGLSDSRPIPFKDYSVLEYVDMADKYKDAVFKHYLFKFEAGIYEKDIETILKKF